jgi:hypothetical protein
MLLREKKLKINIMKDYLPKILKFLLLAIIFYIIFGFWNAEFNPIEWDSDARQGYCIGAVLTLIELFNI